MGQIDEFIGSLRKRKWYESQIEHVEVLSEQKPTYARLNSSLIPPLREYLQQEKIKLYTHQARALNLIRQGKNVVVSTSTSSGKSLIFNLAVFEELSNNQEATALYLYPMKALTNDQLKAIQKMQRKSGFDFKPRVYDGDTPANVRPWIRKNSRLVLSNPYAFHHYLSWHHKWRNFLKNLSFIVIDESHVYRGVFGSNVAFLLRRLRRICEHYGSDPQFILSSATIANPREHSTKLVGKQFNVVKEDGSGQGKKYFLLWNSAKFPEQSVHRQTTNLLTEHVRKGMQSICFTVSRQMAELIAKWSRENLEGDKKDKVLSYRAGYLPEERREIEARLRKKEILGVASTNALELGIDIGSLDAVILSGYPGSMVSTWQQAGRAGRGMEDSLVTLIGFEDPLDQYFMKHPDKFFERSHENAVIDLENPYIVMGHMMCASSELPLKEKENHFGKLSTKALTILRKENLLRETPMGYAYAARQRPVEQVNLNSISEQTINIFHKQELIESMDKTKAYREAYPGAMLLHQGITYKIKELDLKNKRAYVEKDNSKAGYYTQVLEETDIQVDKKYQEKEYENYKIFLGQVSVKQRFPAYLLKRYDKVVSKNSLSLPSLRFETIALWIEIPSFIQEKIAEKEKELGPGLHAAEHAMIALSPLIAMSDRGDVGGVSTPMHPDVQSPAIFIYDGYEGGIGISEKLYSNIDSLMKAARDLIRDCSCEKGCPSCIYSPKCGNVNQVLDKDAAEEILNQLIQE